MKPGYYLTILLLFTVFTTAFAQDDWQLRKNKDGIQVFASETPGSAIHSIKVEAVYNATPAQITAIVMDVNTATQWVSHLKSSTLIKQVSPNELYYYAEVSLPWPATNRDFVAHLSVYHDKQLNATVIDGPAVSGFVPEKKGIVRISNSSGKWIITQLATNQVKVEYTMHVDPAGTLPAWLINMFAAEAPFEIFKNLKQQLQKGTVSNSDRLLTSTVADR